MKGFLLLAALLAACAGAPGVAPAPGGRLLEVREAFTCPLPPSRSLITIPREGKAERVVFEGLEFELGKTKSTREQLTLTPKDAAELFRVVADSGWESIPENPEPDAAPSCADCCSGSLMIKTVEGNRSLHFTTQKKPAKLEALLKAIDGILGRSAWERVVYPWEKQR